MIESYTQLMDDIASKFRDRLGNRAKVSWKIANFFGPIIEIVIVVPRGLPILRLVSPTAIEKLGSWAWLVDEWIESALLEIDKREAQPKRWPS